MEPIIGWEVGDGGCRESCYKSGAFCWITFSDGEMGPAVGNGPCHPSALLVETPPPKTTPSSITGRPLIKIAPLIINYSCTRQKKQNKRIKKPNHAHMVVVDDVVICHSTGSRWQVPSVQFNRNHYR